MFPCCVENLNTNHQVNQYTYSDKTFQNFPKFAVVSVFLFLTCKLANGFVLCLYGMMSNSYQYKVVKNYFNLRLVSEMVNSNVT